MDFSELHSEKTQQPETDYRYRNLSLILSAQRSEALFFCLNQKSAEGMSFVHCSNKNGIRGNNYYKLGSLGPSPAIAFEPFCRLYWTSCAAYIPQKLSCWDWRSHELRRIFGRKLTSRLHIIICNDASLRQGCWIAATCRLEQAIMGKKQNPKPPNTPPGHMPNGWRDFREEYEDTPDRLGGQKGYRLYDGSIAPQLSPYPRLKPGVDLVLEELEKAPQERNTSVIAAGMAMIDEHLLKKLLDLPDPESRVILLKAYDPRFAFLSEDLFSNFLAEIAKYKISSMPSFAGGTSENLQGIPAPAEPLSTPRGPGRPRINKLKRLINDSVEKHPEWRIDEKLREAPSKGEKLRTIRDGLAQKVFSLGWTSQKKITIEWLRGRRALLLRRDKNLLPNSHKKD
jgi:hypothetical protein